MRNRQLQLFIIIAALVAILDQWTKWLAIEHLTHAFSAQTSGLGPAENFSERLDRFLWLTHPLRSGSVEILKDFWHFRYVENPGAAFGFLASSSSSLRTPFFLIVTILAMGFVLMMYKQSEPEQHLFRISLALVFGGAIGNFLDRVRLGYVIDFIDWHWYNEFTWPTFNVADAGISIGACLLLVVMLREGVEGSDKASEPPAHKEE
ncbi:MAG: signal peptidase II [Myxococcota bacterium]|nr:signal peptidase II [Myxococcota bacterium]